VWVDIKENGNISNRKEKSNRRRRIRSKKERKDRRRLYGTTGSKWRR
jgi:hypothetical protein